MCVLRASGERFDVDAFLGASPLHACAIHRQGEPRLSATEPEGPKWTTSGFNVSISEAAWDDLAGQVVDVQAFLARYRSELQRLRTYPGVEGVEIDFPLELRIGSRDVVVQSDRFPPELLLAAGEIGLAITFTIYPPGDEEAEVMANDASERTGAACSELDAPAAQRGR